MSDATLPIRSLGDVTRAMTVHVEDGPDSEFDGVREWWRNAMRPGSPVRLVRPEFEAIFEDPTPGVSVTVDERHGIAFYEAAASLPGWDHQGDNAVSFTRP